jgi:UPF0755 protein
MAAKTPSDSFVFLNRLALNMRWNVMRQYSMHWRERKKIVLFKDLEIDSPYNTYRRTGLTPTPICAVGESALRAVYQPEDTDYCSFLQKMMGLGNMYLIKPMVNMKDK